MTPSAVKAAWDRGEALPVLDVRTQDELDIVQLPSTTHIPLHELPERFSELEAWRDQDFVVACHHGMRSARAVGFLRSKGFLGAANLEGGVDRWAIEVDPNARRY